MKYYNAFFSFCTCIVTLLVSCDNEINTPPNFIEDEKICSDIVAFADSQYRNILLSVDSARRERPNKPALIGIEKDTGVLSMGNYFDWRGGFFGASLWLLYEFTEDSFWYNQAINETKMNQDAATITSHDLGFKFCYSWGLAYKNTHNIEFLDILKTAADTMVTRYNPNVGCIRCWKSENNDSSLIVIIDNMMNIELLFKMTELTGDSSYYKIAKNHADVTLKNHFREDNSSYHVVEYDNNSGKVLSKYTVQGYSNESYWSRGQAWGLYGYTMSYRYTKDIRYLDQARRIADFLLSLQYADDLIPYWDMLSPDIPNTPRDASAATITASALIELSTYCNGTDVDKYLNHARRIIKNLHDGYQSKIGENYGFILLHSTQNYNNNDKVDVPLVYADYYYLEATLRLKELNK